MPLGKRDVTKLPRSIVAHVPTRLGSVHLRGLFQALCVSVRSAAAPLMLTDAVAFLADALYFPAYRVRGSFCIRVEIGSVRI